MDDEGVSEVVGQILMFGILSMVLVLTLLSFNVAKESAEERVMGTTSDSVAQRIASLVVSTSLFAENLRDMDPVIESRLELPANIENRNYEIESDGDKINVRVLGTGRGGTAPLFASGSAGFVHVCTQDAFEGGSVRIRVAPDTDLTDTLAQIEDEGVPKLISTATTCVADTPESELYVFLEPAP